MGMTDKEVQQYKAFVYNEANIHNCENCPHRNDTRDNYCGQQHCWVEVHCQH